MKKGKTYELEVMPAEKRVKDEPKLEPHRVEQKEQKSGLEGEQKRKLFNYQQYLAREGRKNLGSNEIPEVFILRLINKIGMQVTFYLQLAHAVNP